jgi:hypothetical protein
VYDDTLRTVHMAQRMILAVGHEAVSAAAPAAERVGATPPADESR